MSDKGFSQHAACQCGASRFQVKALPVARFICHCRVCQAYTGKPFNDVTVLRARDVVMPDPASVGWRRWRLPPNIRRGSCLACGKPVIETAGIGPLKLVFVPTDNYSDPAVLPAPAMHIFWHRHLVEVDDGLPRFSGYLNSELQVLRLLVGGLRVHG